MLSQVASNSEKNEACHIVKEGDCHSLLIFFLFSLYLFEMIAPRFHSLTDMGCFHVCRTTLRWMSNSSCLLHPQRLQIFMPHTVVAASNAR